MYEIWITIVNVLLLMFCFLVILSPLIFLSWRNNEFCNHDYTSIKKEVTDVDIQYPFNMSIETEILKCVKCVKIYITTTTHKIDTTGVKKTRTWKDNTFLKL